MRRGGIIDALGLRHLGHLSLAIEFRHRQIAVAREQLIIGGTNLGDVFLLLGRALQVSRQFVEAGARVIGDPL